MLARLSGVETIALLDSDDPHDAVDTARLGVWRASLSRAAEHMDISREVGTRLDGKYKTLIPGDQDWPTVMDDLGTRAPYVLWTEGAARLLNFRLDDKATITGARSASSYGVNVAQELTDDLAQDGQIAVAGGAYGIEAEVHRQALARDGATVAVLAGGIDRNYPQGNADLLDRVRHEGVVVSEQPPGAVPTRGRFLARNRLLAALSSATVLVEAGARSGSLGVAAEARTLGRAVGAVPGPITSVTSTCPNLLIQGGQARMVTSTRDVEALMDLVADAPSPSPARSFSHRGAARSQTPGRQPGRGHRAGPRVRRWPFLRDGSRGGVVVCPSRRHRGQAGPGAGTMNPRTDEQLHTAVLVAPAKERRRLAKQRRRAAAALVAEQKKDRMDQAKARQEAARAEARATTYLPAEGEPGPAGLRSPGRFRLPRHQDTSAMLADAYPFLAEGGLGSNGVFVGQDLYSGGSFVYDPWVLYAQGLITAPNVILAGIVGSGKSSLAKALYTRSLPFGRRGYVPGDPKGEHTAVAEAVGGKAIVLSHGLGTRLNPLDEGYRPGSLSDEEWAVTVASRRRDLIGALVETVLARPLSPLEHTAIDTALTETVHGNGGLSGEAAHEAAQPRANPAAQRTKPPKASTTSRTRSPSPQPRTQKDRNQTTRPSRART